MIEEGKNIFHKNTETMSELINRVSQQEIDAFKEQFRKNYGIEATQRDIEDNFRDPANDIGIGADNVRGVPTRPDTNYYAKNDLHRLSREGLLGSKDDNNE